MNILITICARGGSKGIPNKNIISLNGRPLLHYTFESARQFAALHSADIQLSTDSSEILISAKEIGYVTDYIRPSHLAKDTTGKIDVIREAWLFAERKNKKKYDYVLDLDVSSPLRNLKDLTTAFQLIIDNPDALNIFSVNHAARNPYFNMMEESDNGYFATVKDAGIIKSRQQAPKVYDINGSFYFYSRRFMKSSHQTCTTDKTMVYLMPHICFDLDHKLDLILMELLLKERLLDFDL